MQARHTHAGRQNTQHKIKINESENPKSPLFTALRMTPATKLFSGLGCTNCVCFGPQWKREGKLGAQGTVSHCPPGGKAEATIGAVRSVQILLGTAEGILPESHAHQSPPITLVVSCILSYTGTPRK